MISERYKPFYKRNLALAIPVMIAQAGQMVVQIADNVMVGQLGTTEFAGVSFANIIFSMGMVFSICFTQGLTPYIGENYGKMDFKNVTDFFKNSFFLNILLGIVMICVMTAVIPFMEHMGQDPDIIIFAKKYYIITLISLFPTILFFTIRNFSEGIGITKYAMYITIGANVLNIFLNWVLIFGKLGSPAFGVSGAAISTLISRILMLVIFASLIFRIKAYTQFTKHLSKPLIDLSKIKKLFNTSMPIAVQGLVEVTAFSFTSVMVGWLGKEALAANQITTTMSTLSFMIAQGIGAAATITVSHQFGGHNYNGARNAGFAAMHMTAVLMGSAGIIYIIFRRYIPLMFTSDPAVVAISAQLFIIAAIFQIFDATQLTGLASLRALKDVKMPLFYSIAAYYGICLPMGYICGFIANFGAIGVWVGLLFGLMLASILYVLRFNKLTKQLINAQQKRD